LSDISSPYRRLKMAAIAPPATLRLRDVADAPTLPLGGPPAGPPCAVPPRANSESGDWVAADWTPSTIAVGSGVGSVGDSVALGAAVETADVGATVPAAGALAAPVGRGAAFGADGPPRLNMQS
jgi:hypothetical protein